MADNPLLKSLLNDKGDLTVETCLKDRFVSEVDIKLGPLDFVFSQVWLLRVSMYFTKLLTLADYFPSNKTDGVRL